MTPELLKVANAFRGECSPLCDCPCELDGPFTSPNSVFRAKHTQGCPVYQFAQASYNLGFEDARQNRTKA